MAKRVAIVVPVVLLMVAAALFSNLFPLKGYTWLAWLK